MRRGVAGRENLAARAGVSWGLRGGGEADPLTGQDGQLNPWRREGLNLERGARVRRITNVRQAFQREGPVRQVPVIMVKLGAIWF